jgi:hypothetical protein
MRKLTVSLFVSLALAVTTTPCPAAGACDHLWVLDRELWLTQGEQSRLVTVDDRGIFSPRWSPAGDHIAYARNFRFDNGVRSEIVISDENGQVLRTLPIPRDSEVNAIVHIGWRDERHVFAEGHVNPSTTKYLEWDLDSGSLTDEKVGMWFAVSPNGRFIAQRAHVPHGAPRPYDSSMLLINGTLVYPQEGESGYHSFAGAFAWSTDSSRLALADRTAATTEVVIVTPAGGITRAPIAATVAPIELSWSGPNTLIAQSGGDLWRIDASSGRSQRVKNLAVSSQSLTIPESLRAHVNSSAPHLEDTRCKQ